MKRIHALVSGRVQGVWFRAFTRDSAMELGVTGWVRNLPDGRVETMAEGEDNAIKAFIKALWQGPPMAQVTDVRVNEETVTREFEGFEIRY